MRLRWDFLAMLAGLFLLLQAAGALSADAPAAESKDNWILENDALRVSVDTRLGTIAVLDKQGGRHWKQPPVGETAQPRLRNVRRPDGERSLAFEAEFGQTKGKPNVLTVTLALSAGGDLAVAADMPTRDAEIDEFLFLEPFVLDAPSGVLVVPNNGNGHLFPLDIRPFPEPWFSASRLDMPWIGACDIDRGDGYLVIVETSDDAAVQMVEVPVANRRLVAPRIAWTPSMKKFGYQRRLLYHFSPRGGYVAMAKRYRAYAQAKGVIVPLAEKLKRNANLSRLFGAMDVWGDCTLDFAKQAKAAGVEKMLIHTVAPGADMAKINELGYLTSAYDNYVDMQAAEWEKIVRNADGTQRTAWLTWDKKTQFVKRCPTNYLPVAKKTVTQALKERPYLGRFIDVTTAEDLYECYDPGHPLSRGQMRECATELLGYMRSRGLVVGGEHGVWWAVPNLDYIEGMMSGAFYSWPAGHLMRPKTKDQTFDGWSVKWEAYERWGIGHAARVPLWELVFHDCVVSTWYWGDSSDFLLEAAPEITAKKDAFNVLYGTIPLVWANPEGSWTKARDVFLQTYRNTCKLHEVVAGAEMLDHRFVTPDRAVQQTRFSDGTQAIVNFGDKPFEVDLAGRKYLLPQNGFVVHGPKIEQSRALVDGKIVTTIRAGAYSWSDAK